MYLYTCYFKLYYNICAGRSCGFNSSVMMWSQQKKCSCQSCVSKGISGSRFHCIYDVICSFYKEITSVIYKFDHFLELVFMQALDPSEYAFIDHYYPGKVADYLSTVTQIGDDLEAVHSRLDAVHGAALVTFPISPKPHDVAGSVIWINANWKEDYSSTCST